MWRGLGLIGGCVLFVYMATQARCVHALSASGNTTFAAIEQTHLMAGFRGRGLQSRFE